jgi:hypothetical protein
LSSAAVGACCSRLTHDWPSIIVLRSSGGTFKPPHGTVWGVFQPPSQRFSSVAAALRSSGGTFKPPHGPSCSSGSTVAAPLRRFQRSVPSWAAALAVVDALFQLPRDNVSRSFPDPGCRIDSQRSVPSWAAALAVEGALFQLPCENVGRSFTDPGRRIKFAVRLAARSVRHNVQG